MQHLCLLLAIAPRAGALTLGFESVKDNTLYESATGSVSNGAGMHFFAGLTATGQVRRGVLAFDLEPTIPPGTVVDSAIVLLSLSRSQGATHSIGLHRLLADWGEGTSDAPFEEGSGTAATPGDATWIHRFFSTQVWTSPGGDFQPAASATTPVTGVGTYSWSSAALLADIQQWVDFPSQNFGWLLRGDEAALASAARFDTRENPTPAARPRLLVVFRTATDASDRGLSLRLAPAFPNPFRTSTTLGYEVPAAAPVRLQVYDVRGRALRTLVAGSQRPGTHQVDWDGRDATGRALGAGTYFVVLQVEGRERLERLTLLR